MFAPNDRFYVRWHLANIPTEIDPNAFRLEDHGHVNKSVDLALDDLAIKFERVDLAAVNQCSGNSRGFFAPRVAGARWANGAVGNARWTGVRLKDVLDSAGVKAGAVAVHCNGFETGLLPATPGMDRLMVMAVNTAGVSQPAQVNWNPGGFMRNVIESVALHVG